MGGSPLGAQAAPEEYSSSSTSPILEAHAQVVPSDVRSGRDARKTSLMDRRPVRELADYLATQRRVRVRVAAIRPDVDERDICYHVRRAASRFPTSPADVRAFVEARSAAMPAPHFPRGNR